MIYTTDREKEKKMVVASTKAQQKKKKNQPRIAKDQTLVEVDGIKRGFGLLVPFKSS